MGNYQLYLSEKDIPLMHELRKIARREGKGISVILKLLIADYVKKHVEGNPSFEITKWIENPRFKAFPTLGDEPNIEKIMKMDRTDVLLLIDHAERWCHLGRRKRDNNF